MLKAGAARFGDLIRDRPADEVDLFESEFQPTEHRSIWMRKKKQIEHKGVV